jgi:hypothetical protein
MGARTARKLEATGFGSDVWRHPITDAQAQKMPKQFCDLSKSRRDRIVSIRGTQRESAMGRIPLPRARELPTYGGGVASP